MHLLFVTSIVPDGRLESGYEIANDAIIGALRRDGARVTVMGLAWPGRRPPEDPDTIILGEMDVRTQTASSLQKVKWLAEAVRAGLSFSSAKIRFVGERAVREAMQGIGPIDAYILNSFQFAEAFARCFTDRPAIYVAHNVEAKSAWENAENSQDPFQRAMFRREAQLLNALEQRLCRETRFVFTLAEEDRLALGVNAASRSATLSLVTRRKAPVPASRRIEFDAGLIGTWTWQPNRTGLEWFLEQVVPHLPLGFRVRVAGGVASDLVGRYPRVEFVGRVPDASAFVRSAALVPLVSRGGTGVQLKTIETFEMGLPSVATTSSLRGIAHRPENCVVTDDPRAFAAAMAALAPGKPHDVDGRAFYASQRNALDRQIRQGLRALADSGQEAFA
jgi:glycosyltransferase involved in cell wall biosynthesis